MSITEQIINISLRSTSHYVRHLIGKTATAKIHSVYKNTINLLINNQIFSLQPKNGYLTPVSLITNFTQIEFAQLPFSVDECYIFHFDTANCAIFNEKLTALSAPNSALIQAYQQTAQQILRQSQTKGLALLCQDAPKDLVLSAVANYLSQLEAYFHQQDDKSAVEILVKLIGLGIGLTPSGDDFLCGFLAVFHRFNLTQTAFFQTLITSIRQHLHHTNAISARFLECALDNRFSHTFISFLTLSHEENIDIEKWVKALENIGHSSGMDTLFGIYFACYLLNQKEIM